MKTPEMKALAESFGLTVIRTPKGLNNRILWTEDRNIPAKFGKKITIRGTSTEKQWDGTYGFKFQIIGDYNRFGGISIDNINVWRAETPEEAFTKAYKRLKNKLKKDYEVIF
jgi:hypothetical protein